MVILFKRLDKNTIVLSVTNPPTLPVCLAILRSVKSFNFLVACSRCFPDNAIALGLIKKHSFLSSLQRISNWATRKVDHTIVIGRDMKKKFDPGKKCWETY